jgi:hypothetical protein
MADGSLDFSYAFVSGEGSDVVAERDKLVAEAARLIDLKTGTMASGSGAVRPTRNGNAIRSLADDAAELPDYPDVFRITDDEFLKKGFKEVPARYGELARDFRFYWLRMGVGLRRKEASVFKKLEMKIEFTTNKAPPHLRPKSYLIFPEQRFQTILDGKAEASIGFDANYDLKASVKDLEMDLDPAKAKVKAGAASKGRATASLSVGPFHGQWRRAKVEHSGVGLEWVFWRVSDTEFIGQEQGPGFIVVLQVPKPTDAVVVTADLRAYRSFRLMRAPLQEAIEQLPDWLLQFFRAGAPVPAHKRWDITERLG